MVPPSLVSLSLELFCKVVDELPIDNTRELLASCRHMYDSGKFAFNQKCYRVLQFALEHESLLRAKEPIKKQPVCFLEKVFIRIDQNCELFSRRLWSNAIYVA